MKTPSLLTAAVLVATLTACGQDKPQPKPAAAPEQPAQQAAPAQPAQQAAPAAPAGAAAPAAPAAPAPAPAEKKEAAKK